MTLTQRDEERSDAFLEHIKILRALHEFMSRGEGDSDEADVVRDSMDPSWEQMTQDERTRAAEISEELYLEQEELEKQ